jgi:hypothetical protein
LSYRTCGPAFVIDIYNTEKTNTRKSHTWLQLLDLIKLSLLFLPKKGQHDHPKQMSFIMLLLLKPSKDLAASMCLLVSAFVIILQFLLYTIYLNQNTANLYRRANLMLHMMLGSKLPHVCKSETSKISGGVVKILDNLSVWTRQFWNSYCVWYRTYLTCLNILKAITTNLSWRWLFRNKIEKGIHVLIYNLFYPLYIS